MFFQSKVDSGFAQITTEKLNNIINKVSDLEKDVGELRRQNSASHERLFDRVGALEKEEGVQQEQYKYIIEKLASISDNLVTMQKQTSESIGKIEPLVQKMESVEKLGEEIDELKEKPAKQWDNLTKSIIGIIIAAIMGLVLAKIGLQ